MKRLAPLLATVGLIATSLPLLTAPQAAAAQIPGYMRQQPDWHRCRPDQPATYECATLKVPLDYQHPQGRMLDLAISRIKTENPGKRRGVLLFNPGGPGVSALFRPVGLNTTIPKDVRDQYDLIGFDPRGVGKSSPISCGGLSADERGLGGPYRPETFPSDVAWARSVADKCREKSGDVIPHITTRNTARDLDVIRAALGERKISYLGYSYGTYLGAVYSQMFPQRTDRFVLDSGVDPQRVWRGMIQVWATEAEPAFARWTRWAAERSDRYGLGSTPEEVSATFWALVARADRDPIIQDGQKVTGDYLRSEPSLFFSPYGASAVIKHLKSLAENGPRPADGDAPDLKQLLAGSRSSGANAAEANTAVPGAAAAAEAADSDGMAVYWSVVCGDTDNWPRDPDQYARDAARDKAKYPLYGDFASNIKPCAFWQRPVEAATPMKTRADVLTVQNEWDSQTPLVSGQGLHKALKGSRMVLALGGEKHGVYLSDPASCADATVNKYLATGRLPAADVTCQDPPPFP
ncbi:alpha/beta fold hydrolase [Streptomyces nojiriensis]|uniref:alpha/beta fold hydrolase n=1 Tax=Streptomyces nojiriensis TaxID=66374 RepID=UPI00364A6915